jgi:hypothetical protein
MKVLEKDIRKIISKQLLNENIMLFNMAEAGNKEAIGKVVKIAARGGDEALAAMNHLARISTVHKNAVHIAYSFLSLRGKPSWDVRLRMLHQGAKGPHLAAAVRAIRWNLRWSSKAKEAKAAGSWIARGIKDFPKIVTPSLGVKGAPPVIKVVQRAAQHPVVAKAIAQGGQQLASSGAALTSGTGTEVVASAIKGSEAKIAKEVGEEVTKQTGKKLSGKAALKVIGRLAGPIGLAWLVVDGFLILPNMLSWMNEKFKSLEGRIEWTHRTMDPKGTPGKITSGTKYAGVTPGMLPKEMRNIIATMWMTNAGRKKLQKHMSVLDIPEWKKYLEPYKKQRKELLAQIESDMSIQDEEETAGGSFEWYKGESEDEVAQTQEKIHKGQGDDPYEYVVKSDKWHARKKGSDGKWINIAKYKSSIKKLDKLFPDARDSDSALAESKSIKLSVKGVEYLIEQIAKASK